MNTIEMTFVLSIPARRALGALPSPRILEFIAERFFERIRNHRYRDFAVAPVFYTAPQGHRLARKSTQRPPDEKVQAHRTRLTLATFRGMKKLELRGLNLTWQLEEILYFGFKEGWIGACPKEIDAAPIGRELRQIAPATKEY
jgi:hypothetical protein